MIEHLYLSALLADAPKSIKASIFEKVGLDASIYNERIMLAKELIKGNSVQTKGDTTKLMSAFVNVINGNYNIEERNDDGAKIEPHYYTPSVLSLSSGFFPQTTPETSNQNLWQEFLKEAQTLVFDTKNLTPFCETILHLLHKYTVTLPNQSGYLPDVSFYDYAKMLAAMSICLNETDTLDEPFLLVKADMSGIQSYIYDIVSKGAAKNLKGRSFYVQLLSDAVLRKLLNEFSLPQANIVYNSGGNFLMLVPNTLINKRKVDNLEREITNNLFIAHKTAIAVIIDYVTIDTESLKKGTHWITKQLAEQIEEKKKRKFANHIKQNYASLFEAQEVKPQDKITGEDVEEEDNRAMQMFKHDALFQSDKGESPDFVYTDLKLLTFQQICLGRRLKKADYLVVANKSLSFTNNEEPKYQINPANLGIYYYLVEDKIDLEKVKTTQTDVGLQIYSFNELNFIPTKSNTKHQYGFMLYGGNEAPTFEYNYKDSDDKDEKYHTGDTKTFSHLTLRLGFDQKINGVGNLASIKRLGVMLLDVDGLGTVFKEKNFDSLAQYAAFSRHLDYFFLGYINTLWNNKEEFKRHIQIIYSGGDDVFIVGRWDLVIDFAELLQTQLLLWSCQSSISQSPKISLSGGITTVTHKFPIMKAATMAGKAEGKAKAYLIPKKADEKEDKKKNAITLWDTPLNWNLEYHILKQLKTEIAYYIDGYKGVFMNLQGYYYEQLLLENEGLKEEKDKGVFTKEKRYDWKYSYNVRWRIAYYIARTQDRYRRDDSFCKLLETLKQGVFCNSYRSIPLKGNHHFFTLLNLAIRWAELNHRTNYKK